MTFLRALTLILLWLFAGPAQAVLAGVKIQGIDGELRDNVRSRIGIAAVVGDEDVPDSHIAWLHGRATDEIRKALEPFGYYSADVEKELKETEKGLQAIYRVRPGEPVRVTSRNVRLEGEGGEDPALKDAVDDFPVKEGDRLDHRRYESGKRRIENLLAERGYFDSSRSVGRVRVRPEQHAAEVELVWKTGPRYELGEVQFDGGQFPREFLIRYVRFEPGTSFHQDELVKLQRTLADTDYFEQVLVNSVREEARDERVPIRVQLTPRKRDVYSAGVGFGTDSGARVEAGFKRRWLNKRGHRLNVEAAIAQRRQDLRSQYEIPVNRGNIREYAFGADITEEESDTVERQSGRLSASQSGTWHDWDRVVSLNAHRERFQIGTEAERDRLDDEQDATVLYPMLRLSQTRADDPVVPTRGWRLQGYLRAAHESLLSDTSFTQLGVGAKLVLPGPGRDRILLRAQGDTTWVDDFQALPASLRFFAGGDQSLRGFGYQELGPEDDEGNIIGGKHRLLASAEYEHMFTERWGMAVFADAGNAFNDTDLEVEAGMGAGVRWRSPVGVVRVDLATPVTQPGTSVQLHLVIGPDL
jgi:translocation and assembly module TamA